MLARPETPYLIGGSGLRSSHYQVPSAKLAELLPQ